MSIEEPDENFDPLDRYDLLREAHDKLQAERSATMELRSALTKISGTAHSMMCWTRGVDRKAGEDFARLEQNIDKALAEHRSKIADCIYP